MSRFGEIPYAGRAHGSFEEEWGLHKGCSEWWYATGYFEDGEKRMYSFQFTVLHVRVSALAPYIVMLALTDFETGRHEYFQNVQFTAKGIEITPESVGYGETARVEKGKDAMTLTVRHRRFALDLSLSYGKGAVWHCENGLLRMGIPGEKQTTVYYSYPNMPTSGTMTLDGRTVAVSGKTWFDKQGGPYSLINTKTHWEWFSLRFFDDEEMMLFSFPQDDYRDGTYVRADATARRLTEYKITPTDFAYPKGIKYTCRWELDVPGLKEEKYFVSPLLDGQMNLGYYELLAEIKNARGARVGLCFVELLPGVYNKKINPMLLFKKT